MVLHFFSYYKCSEGDKMDATEKFSGLASVYAAGRPAYAESFLRDLYGEYGFSADSVIADIGSGTGKFAKQMLERGSYVYCVEPNEDMRSKSITELEEYKNKSIVAGDAENTGLQDNSVDFITTAQAFHWFDAERFRTECKRIIKPGGKVFLIWNMRDMNSEIAQIIYRICEKYCPNFKGFGGGIQRDDERIKSFFDGKYKRIEYDNPLCYGREKFISRSLSSSYSLKPQDENYKEYISELEALFEEYAVSGEVITPNKTIVYVGSVK